MSIFGSVAGLPAPRADWAQTDEKAADFILHKPDLKPAEDLARQALTLAEGALPRSGGTLTGGLDLGGFRLGGLAEPGAPEDAATKAYVDARHFTARVTLPQAGWEGTGPYSQTLTLAGILESDCPHFGVVYTEGSEQAQKEYFALVDELRTENGRLVFRCFGEKPAGDLTLILEVNR